MKKIVSKLLCLTLVFATLFGIAFSSPVALTVSALSPEITDSTQQLPQDTTTQDENSTTQEDDSSQVTQDAPRKIMVLGGGKVTAQPDVAYVEIGVESLNADLQTALDENNQIISSLIDYLQEKNVAEDDIKTKYYSIYQKHDYSASDRFLGYQVSSTLEFKCTDLNNLGTYIKDLTSLGANRLGCITFDCQDITSYYQEALKLAVEDAKSKAEALSSQPLTIVKIIEENVYTSMPYRMMETSLSNASTILKGTMKVEAKIKVIFE